MRLSRTKLVALFGVCVLAAAAVAGGCSGGSGANPGDSSSSNGSGGGGDPTGSGAGPGSGGSHGSGVAAGIDIDGGIGDGSLTEDTACVAVNLQADYEKRPADIIFMIDNSGSMTEEIESIQRNINGNFASIIAKNEVDYRVIMISRHGSAKDTQSICIGEPLGKGTCDPVPSLPNVNEPFFYQYDIEVPSKESLCLFLDTLKGGVQPRGGSVPGGWSTWLRPDSLKVFVNVTDDNVNCTTKTMDPQLAFNDEDETIKTGELDAKAFDAALTSYAPEHFGTPEARNYVFFSLVGLKDFDEDHSPHPPTAPVLEGFRGQCPDAVGPGTSFQTLSVMTGGLRYPVCGYDTYDKMFQAIADSVVSGAKLTCDIIVPDAPDGKDLDLDKIQIEFTPSDGGEKETFAKVKSAEECKAKAFYIEDSHIKICPETCEVVSRDNAGHMSLLYGCLYIPD